MLAKFGLFLSAYSPLSLILMLQNILALKSNSPKAASVFAIIVFLFMFLLGIIAFILVIFRGKDKQVQKITVLSTHLSGGDTVGYLSSYILPFITGTEFDLSHILAYVIFFAVACAVTVHTDVIQINPLFFVFGYRIYSTEATFKGITEGYEGRLNVVLITKKKLVVGQSIDTYQLNEEVRLV